MLSFGWRGWEKYSFVIAEQHGRNERVLLLRNMPPMCNLKLPGGARGHAAADDSRNPVVFHMFKYELRMNA